ncbi:MAG: cupin domain-containing protein [Deltaproteobacteria bacterium]|nr:cupin domain-containing protein [Deltaproteobacteria bacterium]
MSMRPFPMNLNFKTGKLTPNDRTNIRKLSDMKGMFFDTGAEGRILEKENPLIYSFSEKVLPEENGHLQLATTTIHPGKVGDEYHMTKGHYHRRPDTSEMYLGLEGEGCLLMQTVEGDFESIAIRPGTVAYIPPFWGHRMVNTGKTAFVFFAVYPGDAGHNYGDIEKTGFVKILIERDGKPLLIDNPKWKRG